MHMNISFNTFKDSTWLMTKSTSCSFFQHFQQSGKFDHFWLSWILCFPLYCYHKAFGFLRFWQTCHTKQSNFVQQGGTNRDKLYQLHVFSDMSNRNCRDRIGDGKSTGETTTFLILFLDDYKRRHIHYICPTH